MSTPTQKDADLVLRYAFDDATNTIRTTATFTGPVVVALDQTTDSVAIGDGTTLYTGTTVGPAHAQDVNVVHSVLPDGASQEHVTAASPNSVRLSDGAAFYKATTPSDTQPVSAVSLPLPTGASTAANQATEITSLSSIDGKLNSLGQKASAASVPVVVASDQSAIPVTAASLPLPSGAATSANQVTEIASLSSIDGKLNDNYGVSTGALRTASQIGNTTGAANFGAGTTGAQTLRVVLPTDQTAIPSTQSGTWNINNVTGTVSLPTGASTAANQATEIASLASIDGKLNSLGQKTSAASVPVVIASDQSTIPVSAASLPLPTGAATEATLSSLNGKVNDNYGVATGAVRTAAQVGNTTGQADFNAGTTSAQTLRVVLPTDQSSIPVKAATPTAGTVTQAAITVGTSAVRATVSGGAPSATRSVLLISPDSASTAKFYIGSATVTNSGATRGFQLLGGDQVAFNSDAGDYYIVSDTAAQTVYITEQA